MSLEFQSKIASTSSTAHHCHTQMFSLVAISSRLSSNRVSLTSSSMTASTCFSLSKSATKSRSATYNRTLTSSTGCARVPQAGRRAVDARALICLSPGMTSRRACRYRTSRRNSSNVRARGCGGRAQCAGRSPHGTAPYKWSFIAR